MTPSFAYFALALAAPFTTSSATSVTTLLDQALTALGGRDALSSLEGVAFNA